MRRSYPRISLMKNARSIYYLIGASILLIFANTIIFLQQSSKNENNYYSAKKTYEIIESANLLINTIRDAETQQRGYLLTSDSTYLKPYLKAINSINGRYSDFNTLLITNSSQRYDLAKLRNLIKSKASEIRRSVSLKYSGNTAGAYNLARSNEGLYLMADIEAEISKIINREKQALLEKNQSIEKLSYRIQVFSVISNWVLLIIVVSALLNIMRNREKIETLFSQIGKKNTILEGQRTELQKLSHNLIQQNGELERFAHVASHDLRSPAANLSALLHLYEVSKTAEERQELIDTMNVVSKNLESKLNDLIEILRTKNNTQQAAENLSIHDIYDKVVKNLSTEIQRSGASLNYDFSEADRLTIPRSYLESILQNLISNGIKYRHPNRVPVVDLKTFNSGGHIGLSVSDNGIGIDLEKYGEDLFGLYNTFHGNKDSKGVGLYITKAQILAIGGSIEVDSTPNRGTTFTIIF